MGRAVPWRAKCPPLVVARLQQVATGTGYLVVQQPGPAFFVLKDVGDSQRKFKVKIGEQQECSCPESKTELCTHLLFVMAKVFRVPATNPVIWQRGLLEAEVEQLVFGGMREGRRAAAASRAAQAAAAAAAGDELRPVERRPVEDGDSCPICCDDLDPADRSLVHCRFGCGNHVHATCFTAYAKHHASSPAPLQCPLCRSRWGPLNAAGTAHDRLEGAHGVACSACRGPVAGDRYRCAFCVSFNLCRACFANPAVHAQHPFDVSSGPGQPFRHVDRPTANPSAAGAAIAPSQGVDPLHAELMQRSLGPEDYERLLRLDDGAQPRAGTVLTAAEVTRLQRVHFDAAVEVYLECAICLEAFDRGDNCVKLVSSCGHIFHSPCALRWFTESRACCPIDNIPVVVPAAPLTRAAPAPTAALPGRRASRDHGGAREHSRAVAGRRAAAPSSAPPEPGHRFSEVLRGRAPLARTGNVTEGSFRPTVNDLAGLSLGVVGLSAAAGGGSSVPPAAASLMPRVGGPMPPGPVVPARVGRLRALSTRR